jgi:hypothetical protein
MIIRYWVLGIGYWVLGIGYWVLGIGYWVLGIILVLVYYGYRISQVKMFVNYFNDEEGDHGGFVSSSGSYGNLPYLLVAVTAQ